MGMALMRGGAAATIERGALASAAAGGLDRALPRMASSGLMLSGVADAESSTILPELLLLLLRPLPERRCELTPRCALSPLARRVSR